MEESTADIYSQKPSGMATASLVLGIIGLILVPIVCSTLAVIFGAMEWSKAPENAHSQKVQGVATSWGRGKAGCILGIIGLGLWIIILAIL